jgi:apolipoprotein N-acyltransferase
VFGVSFWLIGLNVCVYMVIKKRDSTRSIVAYTLAFLLLLVLPYFYGKMVIPHEDTSARKIRVGIVQGNIDPYLKWDKNMLEMNFSIYEKLTRKIPKGSTDLNIWPETATPTYLLHDPRNLWRVQRLVAEMQTPILTGTPDYVRLGPHRYKTFNSVVLQDGSDGPFQKYAKMQLVPFGERVPFEDAIPILKTLLDKLDNEDETILQNTVAGAIDAGFMGADGQASDMARGLKVIDPKLGTEQLLVRLAELPNSLERRFAIEMLTEIHRPEAA